MYSRTAPFRMALVIALLFITLVPTSAHAYIDPGTGSYLLQLIVAGILSGLFVLKTYWAKFKGLFGARSQENEPSSSDE